MYISKPEEGFCVPVLYIDKKELNIGEIKDISEYKKNIKIDNSTDNDDLRCSQDKENSDIVTEKVDKLIIDNDEEFNEEKIKDFISERKNKADKLESGVLILDAEIVEENEKKE